MKNSVKIGLVVAVCVVVGIGILIGVGATQSNDPYKNTVSYEYKVDFVKTIPTTLGDQTAPEGWKYALYTVTVYNNLDSEITVKSDYWTLDQAIYGKSGVDLYTELYTGANAYKMTKLNTGEKCTIVLIFDVADVNCEDKVLDFRSTAGYTLRK